MGDILLPGLRDRRLAASDETISVSNGRIYGRGSVARAQGAARSGLRRDRPLGQIRAIILHQTAGRSFLRGSTIFVNGSAHFFRYRSPYLSRRTTPEVSADRNIRSDHPMDQIAAHFVVLNDGTIFYTHDVEFIIASAGGRFGIDIEFAGRFPCTGTPPTEPSGRLSTRAIQAGRQLIRALTEQIRSITNIHPHGQVQRYDRQGRCGGPESENLADKWTSCPGPDIWVNVGEWAARNLRVQCDDPGSAGYQNNTISPAQSNEAYDQGIH